MTRKSRRELERALADLDASTDGEDDTLRVEIRRDAADDDGALVEKHRKVVEMPQRH